MKDRTIFSIRNYVEISQKNFSKLGFKKMKPEVKDRLFEIISLVLGIILKFIWIDFKDEKLQKNFNSEEKKTIQSIEGNLES